MKRRFVSPLVVVLFFFSIGMVSHIASRNVAMLVISAATGILFGVVSLCGYYGGFSTPINVFLASFSAHLAEDWLMGFVGNTHKAAMLALALAVVSGVACAGNSENWKKLGCNTGVHPAFQALVLNGMCLIPFIPFFTQQ